MGTIRIRFVSGIEEDFEDSKRKGKNMMEEIKALLQQHYGHGFVEMLGNFINAENIERISVIK